VNEESPLAERHMGFFVMNSTNSSNLKRLLNLSLQIEIGYFNIQA